MKFKGSYKSVVIAFTIVHVYSSRNIVHVCTCLGQSLESKLADIYCADEKMAMVYNYLAGAEYKGKGGHGKVVFPKMHNSVTSSVEATIIRG